MMKEQLITFETAKLAKEKGFPQIKDLPINSGMDYWEYGAKAKDPQWLINGYGEASTETPISAPTQSLLQKWFREEKVFYAEANHANDENYKILGTSGYFYTVSDDETLYKDSVVQGIQLFKTYEEALEEGLKETLKLIK